MIFFTDGETLSDVYRKEDLSWSGILRASRIFEDNSIIKIERKRKSHPIYLTNKGRKIKAYLSKICKILEEN